MQFTDFFEFKNDPDKFFAIAKKGEDIVITKKGKPVLSLAGITKDEVEDFILAKHYKLEKKSRSIESSSAKIYSHKEVKKRLGI